jgi:hypothetical protein
VKMLLAASMLMFGMAQAFAQGPKPSRSVAYPKPLVREEQTVVVNGVTETWQLQWTVPPKPYCEPSDVSLTCPCIGFAYGEIGDLYLVRIRNGSEIDRLHLTPFFKEEKGAAIQRWPPDMDHDFDLAKRDDFDALVRKRTTVQVMQLADYDHDGMATKFYLQTEADPCGKSAGVLVGLSKANPQLHAVGTTSHPGDPLVLFQWEWDALRNSLHSVTVTDWECHDHAAETRTEVYLYWSGDTVDGVRREYTCPTGNLKSALISEKPL